MRNVLERLAMVVAAGVALGGAAPASAQDSAFDAASQKALYDYGYCLANARPGATESFLATFPFSDSSVKQAKRLGSHECLIAENIIFNSETFRGVLYRAMYRIKFGDALVPDLSGAPQIDYGARVEQPVGQSADTVVNLRRFADCIIRQDSAGAQALVQSDFGSGAEGEAFQRLAPEMSSCIVPGYSLTFKRPLLRAVITETFYRLTAANAGHPALADRR